MRFNISPLIRYKLKEIITIILAFLGYAIFSYYANPIFKDFPLLRSIIGGILLGLFTAFFEIKLSPKLSKKFNYTINITIAIAYYYFLFIAIFYAINIFTEMIKFNQNLEQSFQASYQLFLHPELKFLLLQFLIFVTIISILRQTRIMVGQGIITEYIKGKYHNPKSEKRFFMFLDLKSSTEIAEKLGHKEYSSFIKIFFLELDEIVLATHSTIYQYVGDEIVLIWNEKNGIDNANIVRFYFLLKEKIELLKNEFTERFGIYPEFKAGVHFGEVSIAEIGGILKKNIAYHGDTINTTARICSKAKEVEEEFLISENAANLLKPNLEGFIFYNKKNFLLKGKKKEITTFSVKKDEE